MKTRITIYKDPLNEKKWIVARDNGDPSEETVLAERSNYVAAKVLATQKAAEIGCTMVEDECIINQSGSTATDLLIVTVGILSIAVLAFTIAGLPALILLKTLAEMLRF